MEKRMLNSIYGITATNRIRKDYLFKLGFNINSKGFTYWIIALSIYYRNKRNIKMMNLYKEIAECSNKTTSQVERAMRTSSENAKEKIKELYQYDGKLNNRTILNLLTNFEMKDNIDNHIPRID